MTTMTRWSSLAILTLLLAACGVNPPPQPPVTPTWTLTVFTRNGDLPLADVQLTIQDGPNQGRGGQTSATGSLRLDGLKQSGFTICGEKPGWVTRCDGVTLTSSRAITMPMVLADVPPAQRPPRAGIVRLNGGTFVDDDGPYLAVGTTLFWAAWGLKHDRDRLEQNLAYLARTGVVDYIRVLGTVGPGSGWADRTVDPRWPDYDQVIRDLTDLAYDRYGLRVEWTIFGGTDLTPTPGDRQALVLRFVTMAQGRAHKIQHWEVANEAWQTGFDGTAGRDELRQLGAMLASQTPNLVALTAAPDGCKAADSLDPVPCDTPGAVEWPGWFYGGSQASLVTHHPDRDQSGEGLEWRPHRQVWEFQFLADVPRGWTNNEPIGPQSSVNTDDDPTRLAMGAGLTWLTGGAGHVLHTGAGIRGGGQADLDRGRAANLWDSPNMDAILAGIGAVRQQLPADVAAWQRQNTNNRFPGYPFDTDSLADAVESGRLLRAFCATADRFVCLPIRVAQPVTVQAKAAMVVTVREPLTGTIVGVHDLAAGASFVLEPAPLPVGGAYILQGVWR